MRVYTKVVPLRWGDLDAMKHLNNTLYFRLMEEARLGWFYEHGLLDRADGEGALLAHASCDFLKPMTWPCTARVTHTITRIGRASLDVDVTIEGDEAPPVVYATGKNVLVWIDLASGTSRPWPDAVRQAVEGQ